MLSIGEVDAADVQVSTESCNTSQLHTSLACPGALCGLWSSSLVSCCAAAVGALHPPMLCINVTALVSFSEALLTMSCQQRGSGAASEQSSVSLCCRWAFWAASLMDAAAPHTLQANTGLGLRHLQPLSLQQASSLLLL